MLLTYSGLVSGTATQHILAAHAALSGVVLDQVFVHRAETDSTVALYAPRTFIRSVADLLFTQRDQPMAWAWTERNEAHAVRAYAGLAAVRPTQGVSPTRDELRVFASMQTTAAHHWRQLQWCPVVSIATSATPVIAYYQSTLTESRQRNELFVRGEMQ